MSGENINKISIEEYLVACHDGDLYIVKRYVEQGGNIHVKTSNGNDGFSRAIYRSNLEVADYLLEHGANINSQSAKGKTPLHRAIYRGKIDSIKFLLEKGANLDVQDKKGDTALHYAARFNYNIVATLLIDKGANLKVLNYHEQTALDVAKSNDQHLMKMYCHSRNIIEGNFLISDELGSVQEILEEKLLEQASESQTEIAKIKETNENQEINNEKSLKKLSIISQLKQFAEVCEEAISKDVSDPVMHKGLLSLKEIIEEALIDANEGRLDQAEAILDALIDVREGRSYVGEVEANTAAWENPNAEPESASSGINLAGDKTDIEKIVDPNSTNDVNDG